MGQADFGRYLSVGFGMGTGQSGGMAVTGFIQAGATFGDTELTVGGFDFFLVHYDSRGNAVWAKQTGSDTRASGGNVAVDAGGNVVVAGSFAESFALDGVEITAAGVKNTPPRVYGSEWLPPPPTPKRLRRA